MSFTIGSEALEAFCRKALERAGFAGDHADIMARVLVFADRRGVASHGAFALEHYIHHLNSGGLNVSPNMTIEREGAAFASIDADNGPGAAAAHFATRLAIEKARASGISLVTVRNSNHFGAGAFYALMGAAAGMIAEVYSNTPPMMAPTGGRQRVLGNNPLSIAVPAAGSDNLVLDMAMSAAAGGRILGAAQAGRAIPTGWLLTPSGEPTEDPNEFHRGGALVPFGGYKGYGLALVIEALAGVLSGAGISTQVTSFRRQANQASHTGHTIRMTLIEAFMPLSEFRDRMAFLGQSMKQSEKATGVAEILMPGELEMRAEGRSELEGVTLSEEAHDSLRKLAADYRIPFPS